MLRNVVKIYSRPIFECSCCPHRGTYYGPSGHEPRCVKGGFIIHKEDDNPNMVPDWCPLPDRNKNE